MFCFIHRQYDMVTRLSTCFPTLAWKSNYHFKSLSLGTVVDTVLGSKSWGPKFNPCWGTFGIIFFLFNLFLFLSHMCSFVWIFPWNPCQTFRCSFSWYWVTLSMRILVLNLSNAGFLSPMPNANFGLSYTSKLGEECLFIKDTLFHWKKVNQCLRAFNLWQTSPIVLFETRYYAVAPCNFFVFTVVQYSVHWLFLELSVYREELGWTT